MNSSDIVLYPNPILRAKNKRVEQFGPKLDKVIEKLMHILGQQRHGIGIAAPQIGINLQLAIVDVSKRIPEARRLVLANPEILDQKSEKRSREGCMSLPEYTADLKRYDWIRFQYQDQTGEWIVREAIGIEAVCIQHEIDHLQGVLFFDRVAALKTDMIPRSSRS